VMSDLNKDSLSGNDPRVEIIVNDAISFLRHAKDKKYDLVLIDFPFPNGHELSKLYSYEFYTLVRRVITPETILIIDMPIVYEKSGLIEPETLVILRTLKEAAFRNRLAFGPHASFLATTLSQDKLNFDFNTFPESMALSARVNLIEILNEEDVQKKEKDTVVNSMFWPRGL